MNLKLCRLFSDRQYRGVQTVRQDVLISGSAQQVPAGAHQVVLDPNGHFAISQAVEVAGEQMTIRQSTVFRDDRERQVVVHQNVMGLRREDAGGQGNHNEGQNNDRDHRQAIPIAADGDEGNDNNDEDLRQAIPIAERVFGRLPTPATFEACGDRQPTVTTCIYIMET